MREQGVAGNASDIAALAQPWYAGGYGFARTRLRHHIVDPVGIEESRGKALKVRLR